MYASSPSILLAVVGGVGIDGWVGGVGRSTRRENLLRHEQAASSKPLWLKEENALNCYLRGKAGYLSNGSRQDGGQKPLPSTFAKFRYPLE
jgi:hypothetical protein